MAKLQCPKCKQVIEINGRPADGKIKCSHCQTEFALKSSGNSVAAAATSGKAASKSKSAQPVPETAVDPNDPFAAINLDSLGKGRKVDLGVAPISSAVTDSPMSSAAPWLKGNAPSYVPISEEEAASLSAANQKGGKVELPKAKTGTANSAAGANMTMIIVVAAVLVIMAGGAITAAVMVAGRSSNGSAGNAQAAEKKTLKVPKGFEVYTLKGVDAVMPIETGKSKQPPGLEGRLGISSETGSYYMFCVTDQLGGTIDADKVSKAARNMLQGDILGASEITVAGHKGWRGSYSVGVYLPDRTTIEMIPLDDRFIVRGYIKASSMKDGFDPDAPDNSAAEQAELEMFLDAINVGKKPGWFGG